MNEFGSYGASHSDNLDQSLGSWRIKVTDESTLDKVSSANLLHHDPRDL